MGVKGLGRVLGVALWGIAIVGLVMGAIAISDDGESCKESLTKSEIVQVRAQLDTVKTEEELVQEEKEEELAQREKIADLRDQFYAQFPDRSIINPIIDPDDVLLFFSSARGTNQETGEQVDVNIATIYLGGYFKDLDIVPVTQDNNVDDSE